MKYADMLKKMAMLCFILGSEMHVQATTSKSTIISDPYSNFLSLQLAFQVKSSEKIVSSNPEVTNIQWRHE